jgi:hypothetical protein
MCSVRVISIRDGLFFCLANGIRGWPEVPAGRQVHDRERSIALYVRKPYALLVADVALWLKPSTAAAEMRPRGAGGLFKIRSIDPA